MQKSVNFFKPYLLARCPFCGRDVTVHENDGGNFEGPTYYVSCDTCEIKTMDFTHKESAVNTWNYINRKNIERVGEDDA